MSLVPVKTPLLAKKMFPDYIWNIPTYDKVIYLTFDDGPTPDITEWALKALAAYNAKATFFCIGNNIKNHPGIFQETINQGHTIGNHTYNHVKGWKTKTEDYINNIGLCEAVIKPQISNSSIVNQQSLISNLFRPPYGRIKPSQAKKLMAIGYQIIMWDVLSFDWDKNVPQETCFENIIENATNGSIIVFHDSVKASKNMMYALPKVLDYYSKQGYKFKPLVV